MNATSPDCARAVIPIRAINKIIIGNMWNFLLLTNNSKISLIVDNLDMLQFLVNKIINLSSILLKNNVNRFQIILRIFIYF